jgi:hypothetical protein
MSILTLQTVLSQARTLLNDDAGSQFPDSILIPKIQLAHQELQTALWDAGSPSVRAVSSPIQITAGNLTLTPTSSPALPSDYLTAFRLMESAASTGPWTPMTEVMFITDLQLAGYIAGATLKWWCNIQDQIAFLGSTNSPYIIMNYRRFIALPVAATDSLGVPFAEQYLSYRAGALAGGSLGDPNSLKNLSDMATANLVKVVMANRGKQMSPIKP